MNATLREQLKQLRLSGLSESRWKFDLQEAKSSKLDHAEFLELILADELVIRNDRKIARRTKAAAFRDQKKLDDFDFEFNTSVKRKQVFDMAAGDLGSQSITTRSSSGLPELAKAISFKASAAN